MSDAKADSRAATDWSNVPTRLGSALVIVSVVGVCLWFGGWVWAVAIAVLGARATFEWLRMSHEPEDASSFSFAVSGLCLAAFLLIFTLDGYEWPLISSLLVVLFLVFTGVGKKDGERETHVWSLVGIAYIVLPLAAMIALRGKGVGLSSEGFQLAAFIILVVIAADAGAYFTGKAIGGPKLIPRLSPNKTWVGFAGGLVLGGLVGGGLSNVWGGEFVTGVPIALAVVVAAVAGDFLESGFKRHFGVKDTGTILPGHGGVLDRVDSHMAAFAVAAVVLWIAPGLSPV